LLQTLQSPLLQTLLQTLLQSVAAGIAAGVVAGVAAGVVAGVGLLNRSRLTHLVSRLHVAVVHQVLLVAAES